MVLFILGPDQLLQACEIGGVGHIINGRHLKLSQLWCHRINISLILANLIHKMTTIHHYLNHPLEICTNCPHYSINTSFIARLVVYERQRVLMKIELISPICLHPF